MEFRKKKKEKTETEIFNIKRIRPTTRYIHKKTSSDIPNIKQYNTFFLSGKNYKSNAQTHIRDKNDFFFQQIDSSLKDESNAYNHYKKYPNNSFEKYAEINIKEIPLKKEYSQSFFTNPINASQTMINNSYIKHNQNSDKNSASLIMLDSINNNMNNYNEIDSDKDRDNSLKIRYHRAKRYSPFYKNALESDIYNKQPNKELDEDIEDYDNKMRTFQVNRDNLDIKELSDLNQIKTVNNYNNNIINEKQFIYSSDEGGEHSHNFEENTENIPHKKTIVRKYTDIYDPNKNSKGILLPKTKMTFSLSSSPLSFEKRRNFSKNSKLSDLIMNQKKWSLDRVQSNEDFFSGSEDRTTWQNDTKKREKKTFNRQSFEKYQQSKTLIRLNKSPQERFRSISLAMISSKGKNTENRPILTNMRFERGGVVDLAQSDSKKNRYKYLIKKMKRPKEDQLIHNNPKYREKAAQLIKEWWLAIKEYRKKRNESATLIQSYFRGRFVRKYLYDVIYINYIYFGFCKKIEKFIKKKYGPYLFRALFYKYNKQKLILRKIIERQNKKRIKLYLKKWNLINKISNKKNLSLLYILRIRAIRESKMFNLKRVFSKWNYISIIKKERTDNKYLIKEKNNKINYDNKEIENEINKIEKNNIKNKIDDEYNNTDDDINKIKGLFKILNGTDKLLKKKALEIMNIPLKNYLYEKKRIIQMNKEEIMKIKIELFLKKLEPYINSNENKKYLYDIFIKSIAKKMKKSGLGTRNKNKKNSEKNEDEYIITKEYKNKKIKKEKIKEYDIMDSEEEESENDLENKMQEIKKYKEKVDNLKKYYLLRYILRIRKYNEYNNMRKYLLLWKGNNMNKNNNNINENYIQKLIKIQTFFRKILSKNKLENIQRLNNSLMNIINRRKKNNNIILLYYLRKWASYIKQMCCINEIEYIQKNFRKYINNKNRTKLKLFFINKYKEYIINTLKNIANMNQLKLILKNIAINRIGKKMNNLANNKRICKILKKIIINNDNLYNNDLEKFYLNKWTNRKNIIKNKDNKRKKRLLLKIFNKKDNIKNVLKSYFLKWQRIHNLLLINDSVIKIQRNWKRKKISNIKNQRKKEQINFIKNINDILNKRKKNNYSYFLKCLKNINRKYILSQFTNNFENKRNNIIKDILDNINKFIKYKYLSKAISLSTDIKKRILRKYIKQWNQNSKIKNKKNIFLIKCIKKQSHIYKYLKLYFLKKWLYHTKYNIMEKNIRKIQAVYKTYRDNKSITNNWNKLKAKLLNKKTKNEIKEILKHLKANLFLIKIKKCLSLNANKYILKIFEKYNRDNKFKIKMGKILNELNNKKYTNLLQKYFNIWYNKTNKEIEREEKLNNLLSTIEKRMSINSAKFLSQACLIKNIYDTYAKYRKFESFKILKKYAQNKTHIHDFSKNISTLFNNIKFAEKKIILEKILKYYVFVRLIKLLEKIKQNRNKEVKKYKIKLFAYLKKKKEEFLSSEKSKRKNTIQYMSPKDKQKKLDTVKKFEHSKTKSQSIITISNKKTRNFKDKEKDKEKEVIKKKIVKNFNSNGKSNIYENKRGINYRRNKFNNEEKISRRESEYDSENNNIKENINAIYEPLLGALNKVINKVIIRKKKEYLIMIKKRIKIYEEEKEKERIYYIHKLHKTLRSITIKKLFFEKNELLKAKKLINLIKLTRINSQISTDRYIRQIIRRWRFISFVKIMSKKKLELMYKNLHVGYLEIINSLFNNESQFPSVIKEFENFGSNVGMYKNSDILNKEKDLYQKVKKKYIAKPIEYDRQNLINIESGKFINELKYKSDEEQGEDYNNNTDSDKDVINKIKNRMRRSVNYDRDKP